MPQTQPDNSIVEKALWVPCIENRRTGRHTVRVGSGTYTYEAARTYLEEHYPALWKSCDASVQYLPTLMV